MWDNDPYYIDPEEENLLWEIDHGETDEDYERMLRDGPN